MELNLSSVLLVLFASLASLVQGFPTEDQNDDPEQTFRELVEQNYEKLNWYSKQIISGTDCALDLNPTVLSFYQNKFSSAMLENLQQVFILQEKCCPSSWIKTSFGYLKTSQKADNLSSDDLNFHSWAVRRNSELQDEFKKNFEKVNLNHQRNNFCAYTNFTYILVDNISTNKIIVVKGNTISPNEYDSRKSNITEIRESQTTPTVTSELSSELPVTTESSSELPVTTESQTFPLITTESSSELPVTTESSSELPVTTESLTTSPVTTESSSEPPVTTELQTTTPVITDSSSESEPPVTTEFLTTLATEASLESRITTESPTIPPVTTESSSKPPVTTESQTTSPVTTETSSELPVTTESLTTLAVTTEDSSEPPVTTESQTTPPVATEFSSEPPVTTESQTAPPVTTEFSSEPPVTTETSSELSVTTESRTTPPVTTEDSSEPPVTTESQTTPRVTTDSSYEPPVTTESQTSPLVTTESLSEPPVTPVAHTIESPIELSDTTTSSEVTEYPTETEVDSFHNPSAPFVESIRKYPFTVFISGIFPKSKNIENGPSFNVQLAIDPEPDCSNRRIAFYLSLRPNSEVKSVVRNSGEIDSSQCVVDLWENVEFNETLEETQTDSEPTSYGLIPGKPFNLTICVCEDKIRVTINGQSAFDWHHRELPNMINRIVIESKVKTVYISYPPNLNEDCSSNLWINENRLRYRRSPNENLDTTSNPEINASAAPTPVSKIFETEAPDTLSTRRRLVPKSTPFSKTFKTEPPVPITTHTLLTTATPPPKTFETTPQPSTTEPSTTTTQPPTTTTQPPTTTTQLPTTTTQPPTTTQLPTATTQPPTTTTQPPTTTTQPPTTTTQKPTTPASEVDVVDNPGSQMFIKQFPFTISAIGFLPSPWDSDPSLAFKLGSDPPPGCSHRQTALYLSLRYETNQMVRNTAWYDPRICDVFTWEGPAVRFDWRQREVWSDLPWDFRLEPNQPYNVTICVREDKIRVAYNNMPAFAFHHRISPHLINVMVHDHDVDKYVIRYPHDPNAKCEGVLDNYR